MTRKNDGPFSVRGTITDVRKAGLLIWITGVDNDRYEVIANTLRSLDALVIGDVIDIAGHDIYAYSGELGPWAPARIPRVDTTRRAQEEKGLTET